MGKVTPMKYEEYDWHKIGKHLLYGNSHNMNVGKFRFGHCERVCDIAKELADGRLDPVKIEAMCYIHDAFKYVDPPNHGLLAARLLQGLYIGPVLRRTYGIKSQEYKKEMTEWKMVFEALTIHSNKEGNIRLRKRNLYASILIDADILDKLHFAYNEGVQRLFNPEKELVDLIRMNIGKVDCYQGTTNTYASVKDHMLTRLWSDYETHEREMSKLYAETKKITDAAAQSFKECGKNNPANPPLEGDS